MAFVLFLLRGWSRDQFYCYVNDCANQLDRSYQSDFLISSFLGISRIFPSEIIREKDSVLFEFRYTVRPRSVKMGIVSKNSKQRSLTILLFLGRSDLYVVFGLDLDARRSQVVHQECQILHGDLQIVHQNCQIRRLV